MIVTGKDFACHYNKMRIINERQANVRITYLCREAVRSARSWMGKMAYLIKVLVGKFVKLRTRVWSIEHT